MHITDTLDLTLGLRYTNDKKRFNATFGNDNTACTTIQGLVLDDATNPLTTATARALAGALIGLGCQGNSTAELNGVSINDKRSEDEFTGTAILSWKPTDDLLLYGSFARGYKAGGFNLDRSALKSPILPFAAVGGAQALVGNLQFDPELVDSYELGAKYSTGPFSLSVSAFRSDFSNFQLNTFNGTVFLVQTVNGCNNLVGGPAADTDLSNATGTCATGDVDLRRAYTRCRIGSIAGSCPQLPRCSWPHLCPHQTIRTIWSAPRRGQHSTPHLRKLPGDNLSNAPELVATSSVTWTPEIGSSGLTGLFYIDGRMTSDYNTGSDLFPQKEQDSFAVFNARIGLRGPDEAWGIELWGQNIFNQDYAQVAFNTPFQAGTTSAPFVDPQYPGGRQIFSQFLAEPRTYGITASRQVLRPRDTPNKKGPQRCGPFLFQVCKFLAAETDAQKSGHWTVPTVITDNCFRCRLRL